MSFSTNVMFTLEVFPGSPLGPLLLGGPVVPEGPGRPRRPRGPCFLGGPCGPKINDKWEQGNAAGVRRSSYVHQQHFRPRSLALICHFQFYLDRRSFQIRCAVHFHCFHMVLSMFAVLLSYGFVHVFSVRIVLAILTSLLATTTWYFEFLTYWVIVTRLLSMGGLSNLSPLG